MRPSPYPALLLAVASRQVNTHTWRGGALLTSPSCRSSLFTARLNKRQLWEWASTASGYSIVNTVWPLYRVTTYIGCEMRQNNYCNIFKVCFRQAVKNTEWRKTMPFVNRHNTRGCVFCSRCWLFEQLHSLLQSNWWLKPVDDSFQPIWTDSGCDSCDYSWLVVGGGSRPSHPHLSCQSSPMLIQWFPGKWIVWHLWSQVFCQPLWDCLSVT